MGCGASSEEAPTKTDSKVNANNNKNAVNSAAHIENGNVGNKEHRKHKSRNKSSEDNNNDHVNTQNRKNQPSPVQDTTPVPKSVAFEVEIDKNSAVDSLLRKPPPKRLQKLAPLENAPKLTAEQLDDKIRQAEENRQQELQKKKEAASRSSRMRRQLLEARQFEEKQEQEKEIIEKQRSADRNREAKQRDMEEKKRRREERARRAKERAARLKVENGEDIDFEVEKDEAYNNDDTDSWLEGENNVAPLQQEHSGLSERLYSGRESPHKTIHVRSSAENRARMSAFSTSTADSFDYAFQRKPPMVPVDSTAKHDDFFDS